MKNFIAQIQIAGQMIATPIKAKTIEEAKEIARNIQFEIAYAADVNNTNYQPEVTETL